MMFTILVSVLSEASWIMPVNADSLFEGNGCDKGCKADREAAEQKFNQALAMGSHLRGESPGFVSTKEHIS